MIHTPDKISIYFMLLCISMSVYAIESFNGLVLPRHCNETDQNILWPSQGDSPCWKCECSDNIRWGCFQEEVGYCNDSVTPILALFENCPVENGTLYQTGSIWIQSNQQGNELCWCNNGFAACYDNPALTSTLTDYREINQTCVYNDTLVLNIGDAILHECILCICIGNDTVQCTENTCQDPEVAEPTFCPVIVVEISCDRLLLICNDDSDCKESQNCCLEYESCSFMCMHGVPSERKPGICPSRSTTGLSTSCAHDYECGAHLKCCDYPGGAVCHEPYDPDECPDGELLFPCTFINPCNTNICEKYPHALCRISHCGTCHAQYFVNQTRVNCYDDDICPPGTPSPPCHLMQDCDDLAPFLCPKYPTAACKVNYCGSCFYEFFDGDNKKVACLDGVICPEGIAELSCGHTCYDGTSNFCPGASGANNVTCVPSKCGRCGFPMYYSENTKIDCFNLQENCPPETETPRFCTDYCNYESMIEECTNTQVDTCNLNYCGGKCVSEYFNSTGHRVSCYGGDLCPSGELEVPEWYCFSSCSDMACPAYPDAMCKVHKCDFKCQIKFYDKDTNNVVNCSEDYVCPEESPPNPYCISYEDQDFFDIVLFSVCFDISFCPKHPAAVCFQSPCGSYCHAEYFENGERVNCFGDIACPLGVLEELLCEDLCENRYCPAQPSAICIVSHCGEGCSHLFQDIDGNLIEDCLAGIECQEGTALSICPYDLCMYETCVSHPEAECRLNHCGACSALFFLPNGTQVHQCSSVTCDEGVDRINCAGTCDDLYCSNFVEATCRANDCGLCTPVFYFGNGSLLSDDNCGEILREGFCEVVPVFISLRSCETDTDCEKLTKCCFAAEGASIKGCSTALQYHPHSCQASGENLNHMSVIFGDREACMCLFGDLICYPTRTNLTMCPVDTPLIPSCVLLDCADTGSCPAYPEARCTVNPCGGCSVEYLDADELIVDCYDAELLNCSAEEEPVRCIYNPCNEVCVAYRGAECRINPCGSCKGEFFQDGQIVDCNEDPTCYYDEVAFMGVEQFYIDGICTLCICLSDDFPICFDSSGCFEHMSCIENGVTYPPLFARRDGCTECICDVDGDGNFSCTAIPGCVERAGVCPPKTGSPEDCVEEVVHQCDSDGNCNGTDKCCHEYCGSVCQPPAAEGPECFSCSSYFSPDIPNTGDSCSNVALPQVVLEKCIFGMVCSSISAQLDFTVTDPISNEIISNHTSLSLVSRGCYRLFDVPDSSSSWCVVGNKDTFPLIYQDIESWITTHEGIIDNVTDFTVSACFCNETRCNSAVQSIGTTTAIVATTIEATEAKKITTVHPITTMPPIITTMPPIITTVASSTATEPTATATGAPSTATGAPSTATQGTLTVTEATSTATGAASMTTGAASMTTGGTSTAAVVTSTATGVTSTHTTGSSNTAEVASTATVATSTAKVATSTIARATSTATGDTSNATKSPSITTVSATVRKSSTIVVTTVDKNCKVNKTTAVSNGQFIQANPCTSCFCDLGFFDCKLQDQCINQEVSIVVISYTLSGKFKDILGKQKKFVRVLKVTLANDLNIHESVFLHTDVFNGSILIVQNITDSSFSNKTAKEVASDIKTHVESGNFAVKFNGRQYRALPASYKEGASYQFGSSNGNYVVVIVVVAVVVVITLVVIFILVQRVRRKGLLDPDHAILLRISRNPSIASRNSHVEFENPIYGPD